MCGEGIGDGAADAGRTGGDEDAQAGLHALFCRLGHGLLPPCHLPRELAVAGRLTSGKAEF